MSKNKNDKKGKKIKKAKIKKGNSTLLTWASDNVTPLMVGGVAVAAGYATYKYLTSDDDVSFGEESAGMAALRILRKN